MSSEAKIDKRAENKSQRLRILNQRLGEFALPGILQDIAKVAGVEAALKVGAEKGGREVYFLGLKSISHDYWLVDLVGKDAAVKITEALFCDRGAHVDVPRGPTSPQAECWLRMRERIFAGMTDGVIARELGVHERTVYRMRVDLRGAGYSLPTPSVEAPAPDKGQSPYLATTSRSARWVEIRKRILDGWSAPKIAAEFGVHHRTVKRIRAEIRVKGDVVPKTKETLDHDRKKITPRMFAKARPTAAQAFSDGASPQEVARLCWCTVSTARKWQAVWRAGVEVSAERHEDTSQQG